MTAEVAIYESPWVCGTRAVAYFGPVSATIFWPDERAEEFWDKMVSELHEALCDKARELGASAIVGFELTLDPFAVNDGVPGMELRGIGTATVLAPLGW